MKNFKPFLKNKFVFFALAHFGCFNFSEMHLSAEIPRFALNEYLPMNKIYHPVSTSNRGAQQSFDRGLTNIYAYNHDLAFRNFQNAAQQDPNLAMAYWGMALALGPNINSNVTPEKEIRAYEYIQKALSLSSGASEVENDYIIALSTRYTNNPQADFVPLRFKYRDAMKKLIEKYPEDLDAATLYAESILNLDPWKYWTWDGKPTEGVLEATEVLSSVLERNPDHVGANHFNIHAWEGSRTPERALMSAHRLANDKTSSGHLLHMPAHIFLLVGDYEGAIKASNQAIAADKQYIQTYGMGGEYPLHYLSHNYYVLVRSYMLSGDYENANRATSELMKFLSPYFESTPMIGSYSMVPLEVYMYFKRWKEILNYKLPQNRSPYVEAYSHFSRALAYANLGNLDLALREKNIMLQVKRFIKEEESIAINPATKLFEILELVLNATLSGVQNQTADQISNLKKAIEREDRLNYSEPPAWYAPIRMQLGGVLLQQRRYPEAADVFRIALKKLPRNGRLLKGLSAGLKGQGQPWNAFWVDQEIEWALRSLGSGQECVSLDEL